MQAPAKALSQSALFNEQRKRRSAIQGAKARIAKRGSRTPCKIKAAMPKKKEKINIWKLLVFGAMGCCHGEADAISRPIL